MKKTLSTHEAAHELYSDENANWSRAGAFALVEYLEQLEDDMSMEIDFCPVSLRCDYSEHESLEDWADDYWQTGNEMIDELGLDRDDDASDILCAVRDYIEDRGTLIDFDGGIIVSNF